MAFWNASLHVLLAVSYCPYHQTRSRIAPQSLYEGVVRWGREVCGSACDARQGRRTYRAAFFCSQYLEGAGRQFFHLRLVNFRQLLK